MHPERCAHCGATAMSDSVYCPACGLAFIPDRDPRSPAPAGAGDTGAVRADGPGRATWPAPPAPAPYGSTPYGSTPYGSTPYGSTPYRAGHAAPVPSTPDGRTWALLAHVTALVGVFVGGIAAFVGPLVIWLLRRDTDPFAAEHARQALNFNLSVLLYLVVGGAAGLLAIIATIGLGAIVVLPLAALLGIVGAVVYLVATVLGALAAGRGRPFRYPLTIQLVR